MKRILITGATGFVGRALCAELARRGPTIRAALRADGALPPGAGEKSVVGNIGPESDWDEALDDVDAVIHLAAVVHRMRSADRKDAGYHEVNAEGTRRLASAAAKAGVKRFVYLSTIKVNGEETPREPFRADDEPRPSDEYAKSKWLGEVYAAEAAAGTGLEPVVVRPPLVYGPDVRANFLRLLKLVDRELMLPFGLLENERSLVSVWNLVDLLIHVLEHPRAPGRAWLVSDGKDLSTRELVRSIGTAMGKRVRLLPVPPGLLRLAGTAVGRREEIDRLCGALRVDISATRDELGWAPPVAVEEALRRTAAWYAEFRAAPSA